MANPQLENGYTRIAHELTDAMLHSRFGDASRRLLTLVMRHTYGAKGSPKTAPFSLAFVAKELGFTRPRASVVIANLIKRRVLVEDKAPGFREVRRLGIQKDYEKWQVPLHGPSPKHLIEPVNSEPVNSEPVNCLENDPLTVKNPTRLLLTQGLTVSSCNPAPVADSRAPETRIHGDKEKRECGIASQPALLPGCDPTPKSKGRRPKPTPEAKALEARVLAFEPKFASEYERAVGAPLTPSKANRMVFRRIFQNHTDVHIFEAAEFLFRRYENRALTLSNKSVSPTPGVFSVLFDDLLAEAVNAAR